MMFLLAFQDPRADQFHNNSPAPPNHLGLDYIPNNTTSMSVEWDILQNKGLGRTPERDHGCEDGKPRGDFEMMSRFEIQFLSTLTQFQD
jgi:hypothetical protein